LDVVGTDSMVVELQLRFDVRGRAQGDSAAGEEPNVLDLRATLSQMTDIAGGVLGEEADQGSYATSTWRSGVEWIDPSTRIATPVTLDGNSWRPRP
jgi:hypothetical protein